MPENSYIRYVYTYTTVRGWIGVFTTRHAVESSRVSRQTSRLHLPCLACGGDGGCNTHTYREVLESMCATHTHAIYSLPIKSQPALLYIIIIIIIYFLIHRKTWGRRYPPHGFLGASNISCFYEPLKARPNDERNNFVFNILRRCRYK